MMTGEKYVERPHPPGESFSIRFSDETAEARTGAQMEAFVDNLKRLANGHGFDICTWGPTKNFVRSVAPAYMEKVWVMRDD